MLALVVIGTVTAVVLAGLLVLQRKRGVPSEPEDDSERLMRVGIELHGLRRRLNVAWTRSHVERDAEATRQAIDDVLNALDREPEDRWSR